MIDDCRNLNKSAVTRSRAFSTLLHWVPGLAVLLDYKLGWFWRDLAAGLVLTAILVPVGMGYAEASGLPAIYGLYATIVPLVAYALFGRVASWCWAPTPPWPP